MKLLKSLGSIKPICWGVKINWKLTIFWAQNWLNSKNKNRNNLKYDFSFDSAHSASWWVSVEGFQGPLSKHTPETFRNFRQVTYIVKLFNLNFEKFIYLFNLNFWRVWRLNSKTGEFQDLSCASWGLPGIELRQLHLPGLHAAHFQSASP